MAQDRSYLNSENTALPPESRNPHRNAMLNHSRSATQCSTLSPKALTPRSVFPCTVFNIACDPGALRTYFHSASSRSQQFTNLAHFPLPPPRSVEVHTCTKGGLKTELAPMATRSTFCLLVFVLWHSTFCSGCSGLVAFQNCQDSL